MIAGRRIALAVAGCVALLGLTMGWPQTVRSAVVDPTGRASVTEAPQRGPASSTPRQFDTSTRRQYDPANKMTRSQANLRIQLPPERLDDPPATRKQLERRAVEPARTFTRGGFTSIQVNVDAKGNNIVGDAANEPSFAIDPTDPNMMAIAWRQFDTIESNFRQAGVAYSHDRGLTWTFPGVLEPGQFRSDPVLAADANGNFYYSSLSALDSVEIFKSTDGGVTWSFPPVYAYGGDKQWMTVDRTGGMGSENVYQNWNVQFTCCYPKDFTRSINGAASFQSPIAIPNPRLKWGTMDVGPGGQLYLAGATLNQSSHVIARSSNAQDPAVTPTFDFVNNLNLGGNTWGGAPNPGGLAGQVWVATDHSGGPTHGNVYVLASVWPTTGEVLDVMFIRSTDGGVSWSTPVRVNDDPNWNGAYQWFGTMSVAPNGRIDAVWNDTRNTGTANLSELFYSFSKDAGVTWSANVPVSPVFDSWLGWPNQNKLGDYYHMISDNDGANLAYAATFNGEQDVYFVHIGHDCNGNGIDDDCDVSCGPPGGRCDVLGCGGSDDCNANNIPDECEADEDCNTNTIRDLCDIAAGTSQDCNWNEIPDECELVDNDCNNNGIPDECDTDCNHNGEPDDCDVDPTDPDGNGQTSPDCNSNGIPDECDVPDCNGNGVPDECDIDNGYSDDCQPDGVPDECQLDDPVILPDVGLCSATANPGDPWCDDLESYAPGSIQGLNDWQGWGAGSGDPGAAGTVTTEQNHTSGGSQSLKIGAYQDTVRLFSGYNLAASPLWVLRAWVYVPSDMVDQAMFIVLADYDGGGGGTRWVASLYVDRWNVWSSETGDWLDAASDSWAEIRLEIDYEQDWVRIFYNDEFLTEHPWSISGGSMNLGAIDLYSPGAGQFYFDDLSLIKPLTTDCNENAIPDECDIADEYSADNDENGIPDECLGACCLCDQLCMDATSDDCSTGGGVFSGYDGLCLDDACPPPAKNDDCGMAEVLPPIGNQIVPINNTCTDLDGPYDVHCDNGTQPFGADLWYEFTAPCDGNLTISMCDNTFYNAIMAVYANPGSCVCPSDDSAQIACDDDSCGIGGAMPWVGFSATADTCYTIRVGGWAGDTGVGELEITFNSGAPATSIDQPLDLGESNRDLCNHQGGLTLADHALYVECMTGPMGSVSICCPCADLNGDQRVDLADFWIAQQAAVGP